MDQSDTAAVRIGFPLARDFLLPFTLLLLLDLLIAVPMIRADAISLVAGVVLVTLPKLLTMPWACIRLLRLIERHFRRYGSGSVKMALFGVLLCGVMVLLISTIESIQSMIFARSEQQKVWTAPEVEYRFGFRESTGRYTIEGKIDFGISRDFRVFLSQHPGGKQLVLNSPGGSVYEGRGLFRTVSDLGLDTHVEQECLSSCVLAFLGGNRRTLATAGKLGFHQYAVDYSHLQQEVPYYNPAREQAHDEAIMRALGIDGTFVKQAFRQPHNRIWMPTHRALREAGVIHP